MASSFSPVRVKAATQEAAIEQAIHMTGATRAEIEVEVLEESEKGVTIRVAPIGSSAASAPVAAAPAIASDENVVEESSEGASTPALEADELDAEKIEADESEEAAPLEAEFDGAEDDEDDEPESAPVAERVLPPVREASEEVKQHAITIADEILERMGLEARAEIGDLPVWCLPTSHDKSERVRDVPRAFMKIEGEDVGILIGKHGNTLQSFQYLLNLTLNNAPGEEDASHDGVREGGVHIVVDAGEYRSRRAEALERQALDAAVRAKRDHRSVRLDPMPGHERRLVHLALYDDKEITTSSEGREPWRRVLITPAGVRVESRGEGRSEGRGEGGYSGNRGGYGNRGGQSGNSGGYGNRGGGNRGGNSGGGGQSGYGGSSSGGSGGGRSYGNSGGSPRNSGRGR